MAGVCEQLHGSTRAPGRAHWEPRAHVSVWHQRLESLQRVSDQTTPLPDTRPESSLIFTTFSTFSNLAFMIETAQKELQKLRWRSRRLLFFSSDKIVTAVNNIVDMQETNPRSELAEKERPVVRRSQIAWARVKVGCLYTWVVFPHFKTEVRPDVFMCLLHSWVSLVSKNYEIERAIVQLENELSQLRQQQGEENKENIRQDF